MPHLRVVFCLFAFVCFYFLQIAHTPDSAFFAFRNFLYVQCLFSWHLLPIVGKSKNKEKKSVDLKRVKL